MVEGVKSSRALVKEIHIDKGVFNLKSERTRKFSASESYKENLIAGHLPADAPNDFKSAVPNLFYAPEGKELISYNFLHQKMADEKAAMALTATGLTDEDLKRIQLESSKKVLKEFGINDKTLLIYSPTLAKRFGQEEAEGSKITVTYDLKEKVLLVKTEWLPIENEESSKSSEDSFIEQANALLDNSIIDDDHINENELLSQLELSDETKNIESLNPLLNEPQLNVEPLLPAEPGTGEHIITEEELQTITETPGDSEDAEDNGLVTSPSGRGYKKPDIEELKKKYKFQKPEKESISDILKRTKSGAVKKPEKAETVTKPKEPEQELKDIITDSLHILSGEWKNNIFTVNHKKSGYLVPVETVELLKDKIIIQSSAITNTEWWTKFTPIDQCRRFKGALEIEDEYAPFCRAGKCNEACGAEDGFVDLSAARFRLAEDSELIKTEFKRLQEFLDRADRLIEEFKSTFEVDILLYRGTKSPYLYAMVKRPVDESVVRNYLEAFITIYTEITDIRGSIDIDEFALDDDYDPVSEDGLVQEARNYGLQEMVRIGAKDLLNDVVREKDGSVEGSFFLIDHGKMRYVLRPTRVEAIRDELYMGNVTFKKGLKDVHNFLVTTLGGGRW